MPTCNACNQDLPLDRFYIRSDRAGTPHPKCKECQRLARVKRKQENPGLSADVARRDALRKMYGITPAEYERILDNQEGVCAICHKPSHDGRRLHVDHDHLTGRVRGLLCHRCNSGIGSFRDSSRLLLQAAEYLKPFAKERDDAEWALRRGELKPPPQPKRRYSWGQRLGQVAAVLDALPEEVEEPENLRAPVGRGGSTPL